VLKPEANNDVYPLGRNNAPAATRGAISPSSIKHLRRDSVWRGNDLTFRRRIVASIAPDPRWLGMWRVKIGDRLSDMVNRVRARDAALALASDGQASSKVRRQDANSLKTLRPMVAPSASLCT
jgi:hypothetical protein